MWRLDFAIVQVRLFPTGRCQGVLCFIANLPIGFLGSVPIVLVERRHNRGRIDLLDAHDRNCKIGRNGVAIDQEPVPLFGGVF